jgi:hypothetical protein
MALNRTVIARSISVARHIVAIRYYQQWIRSSGLLIMEMPEAVVVAKNDQLPAFNTNQLHIYQLARYLEVGKCAQVLGFWFEDVIAVVYCPCVGARRPLGRDGGRPVS